MNKCCRTHFYGILIVFVDKIVVRTTIRSKAGKNTIGFPRKLNVKRKKRLSESELPDSLLMFRQLLKLLYDHRTVDLDVVRTERSCGKSLEIGDGFVIVGLGTDLGVAGVGEGVFARE